MVAMPLMQYSGGGRRRQEELLKIKATFSYIVSSKIVSKKKKSQKPVTNRMKQTWKDLG